MSNKVITLPTGIVCDFGVNWFLKFLKEETGRDPMLAYEMDGDIADQLNSIVAILYAAHRAAARMENAEAVPRETLENLLMSMNMADLGEIWMSAQKSISGEPGEVPAQETEAVSP